MKARLTPSTRILFIYHNKSTTQNSSNGRVEKKSWQPTFVAVTNGVEIDVVAVIVEEHE